MVKCMTYTTASKAKIRQMGITVCMLCAGLVATALLTMLVTPSSACAVQRDIMSFGMGKHDLSYFHQEMSLEERFNVGAFKTSDFDKEELTTGYVGVAYDGSLIDVSGLVSQVASSTALVGPGSAPTVSNTVEKHAPSMLYNPETAEGFEYGTQAESDAAANLPAQSAPSTDLRAQSSAGIATTPTSEWKTAVASWYGPGFLGNHMANGEVLRQTSMIVAHKTLPFGTKIEISWKGRTVVATVKDRGPFIPGRDFDLGPGIQKALNFDGVHSIQYRFVR